jgi:hypothetical protein
MSIEEDKRKSADLKSADLWRLLEAEATRLGKATELVKRQSKLTAAKFVQTLVLGSLECPQASLNDWVQSSDSLGVSISLHGS